MEIIYLKKPGPKRDETKDKKVLALRQGGFSFRQIAKDMNISVATVYQRYRRSIQVKR